MINIVCLKFGTKFAPDYVNRLYFGFKRNLTIPFTFNCFTDDGKGLNSDIKIFPLPHKLPGVGWWQKLYLFSKEIPVKGRIFYADLDTVITGNVDHIVSYPKGFMVLHDFFAFRNKRHIDKYGGKYNTAVGSGLMAWDAGKHSHIWETFIKDPQKVINYLKPDGDQRWVQVQQKERIYFQDLFVNQVLSFKTHCTRGLPQTARIVCYHGKPSVRDSMTQTTNIHGYLIRPAPWVKQHWRDE